MDSYYEPSYRRLDRYFEAGGDYFLDAASGGNPARQFSVNYDKHVCVDFAFASLVESRNLLGDKGLYVMADIANLPFKLDCMAGGISSHTLYHLPPEKQPLALAEYHRVLAPQANFVILYISSYVLNTGKFIRHIWRTATGYQPSLDQQTDPALATPPVWAMTPSRFEQQLPHASIAIFSYRILHQHLSRNFIPENQLGMLILRFIAWLEETFPQLFIFFGYYIAIILNKDIK